MRMIFLMFLLAACGRPLTPNEAAFASALYGDQFDPTPVRLHQGLWASQFSFTRPARPRLTCRERVFPPPPGPTVTVRHGATSLFQTVFFRDDLYLDDFLAQYPEQIDLWDVMLFAHEMAHVWQWQNRAATGYHPLIAATEHVASADPYLFELDTNPAFLSFGFEQQGAIVEEYVCCSALAPDAPRTQRLRQMLSGAFPVQDFDAALSRPATYLPWSGVEVWGICD